MNLNLNNSTDVRNELNLKRIVVIATLLSLFLGGFFYVFFNITSISDMFAGGGSTRTWNGAYSTSWSDSRNWGGGNVPSASDKAYIPGDLSVYPVINSSISVKELKVNSNNGDGATLTVASGAVLVVDDAITINEDGTFIQTGGVVTTDGGIDVSGIMRISGGTQYCDGEYSINKKAHMYQTGGLVYLNINGIDAPDNKFKLDQSDFTQSGGTLHVKDLEIKKSDIIQNEEDGTSLIIVGKTYKNDKGSFVSAAGTIEWSGESSADALMEGTNEFFNVLFSGSSDPGLDSEDDAELIVKGNWTNNNPNMSIDNKDAKVILKGSANAQTIGGSSSTTFGHLEIDNSYGTAPQVVIAKNVRIEDDLKLEDGIVSIGTSDINMDENADLDLNGSASYIYAISTGEFIWEGCSSGDERTFPVGAELTSKGYSPLVMDFNSGHTKDDYSVCMANTVTEEGDRTGTLDTAYSVKLTWFVSEGTPGGTNLDFEFHWDSEKQSKRIDHSKPLKLKHHNGNDWEEPSGKQGYMQGNGPYYVSITGYTGGFSPFCIHGDHDTDDGGGGETGGDVQTCWSVSDSDNKLYKFTLPGMTVSQSISLTPHNVEASTLNLAGDTLFMLDYDDLYYVALNKSNPTAVKVTNKGIDDNTITGANGNKNASDYDAMGVDENGNIWAISEGSGAFMVVISRTTGLVMENYFGPNIDYKMLKLRSGYSIDCMAFDPLTNDLYVNMNTGSGNAGTDFLYKINTSNGDTTRISAFSVADVEGMGFDALGRLLITTGANASPSSQANQLWMVDLENGVITSLGDNPGDDTETCDCVIGENNHLNEISGHIFYDLNNDTLFNSLDSGATSFNISLYEDVNQNNIYDAGTDVLIEEGSTNSNGYFSFRQTYTSGIKYYVLVASTSSLPANHQFTTDNIEFAVFSSGDNQDVDNDFGIIDINALPVELLFLNATPQDDKVLLDWATASEINNQGFFVERSMDGNYFEEVDFVVGNGTTQNLTPYAYLDHYPLMDVSYYRLKQVDYDGAFEYSPIVMVDRNKKIGELSKVYPSPANRFINVRHDNASFNIQILNHSGLVIYEKIGATGLVTIQSGDFPSGFYVVNVYNDKFKESHKILVSH